jgi:alanine racemase
MIPFLKKRKYHHLNTVELCTSALIFNHNALKKLHPNSAICPVLKSNAYGHGLKETTPIFDSFNAPFIVVDSLYEAYELYKANIKTQILILGYTHIDNYKVKKLPFHFALFDLETAHALSEYQPGCSVHIFVDTGMHREGVKLSQLPLIMEKIKTLNIRVVGLASHIADADNPVSQENTSKQITHYKAALSVLKDAGIDPQWRHISASGGAFKTSDDTFNMIRAGIASYGISPLANSDNDNKKICLRPVLTLKTHVIQIKSIPKDAQVGYNGTYIAQEKRTIAILPLGYYEGLNRRLSNKGVVQVRGIDCPIIGNISMNITTIDISHIPEVAIGDEVVVFSNNPTHKNSIKNAAKSITMSPYEMLVKLAESTHREVTP